jgi:hypothetical protein
MGLASSLAVSATTFSPSQGSEIGARLEAARQAVEGRFLEAGDVLSRAVEGVGTLIASLDRMRENLDAETVSKTAADLANAAQTLKSLPDSLDERRGRVGELVKVGDGLGACIEEMRQHLAYLRVFAINIKITSGGIVAAGPEFAIFAQEIYDCIEMGRAQLDAFNADLMSLDTTLRAALAHEHDLARTCVALLPAVPDALTASASAIAAHHAKISGVAVSVATWRATFRRRSAAASPPCRSATSPASASNTCRPAWAISTISTACCRRSNAIARSPSCTDCWPPSWARRPRTSTATSRASASMSSAWPPTPRKSCALRDLAFGQSEGGGERFPARAGKQCQPSARPGRQHDGRRTGGRGRQPLGGRGGARD